MHSACPMMMQRLSSARRGFPTGQCRVEERLELRPRDEIGAVVEIDVSRAGHDEELLRVGGSPERLLAEHARVCWSPVMNSTGRGDIQPRCSYDQKSIMGASLIRENAVVARGCWPRGVR